MILKNKDIVPQIGFVKTGMRYKRIVLIDDDHITNFLNKQIIEHALESIPVVAFTDVDTALFYLKEYDTEGNLLIFLDLNLPTKDGWDFLTDYTNFETKSSVIVLSSSLLETDQTNVRQYPCVVDYLSKPLSYEYLELLPML
jgi:response regulator of citrate/malate metabolism